MTRKNNKKRQDLYEKAKAKSAQPPEMGRWGFGDVRPTGVFLVKPPTVYPSKSGKTMMSDLGGTVWAPDELRGK